MKEHKEGCDCEEMSCKEGCTTKHTHKGFFCEICQPERYKEISSPKEQKTYAKDYSHTHCWNQESPACGIPLEKHTQCCLCDMQFAQGAGGLFPEEKNGGGGFPVDKAKFKYTKHGTVETISNGAGRPFQEEKTTTEGWEEAWMTEEVEALWQTEDFQAMNGSLTPVGQEWVKSAIAHLAHNFADRKLDQERQRMVEKVGKLQKKHTRYDNKKWVEGYNKGIEHARLLLTDKEE